MAGALLSSACRSRVHAGGAEFTVDEMHMSSRGDSLGEIPASALQRIADLLII
jgi:hypothetical protein